MVDKWALPWQLKNYAIHIGGRSCFIMWSWWVKKRSLVGSGWCRNIYFHMFSTKYSICFFLFLFLRIITLVKIVWGKTSKHSRLLLDLISFNASWHARDTGWNSVNFRWSTGKDLWVLAPPANPIQVSGVLKASFFFSCWCFEWDLSTPVGARMCYFWSLWKIRPYYPTTLQVSAKDWMLSNLMFKRHGLIHECLLCINLVMRFHAH